MTSSKPSPTIGQVLDRIQKLRTQRDFEILNAADRVREKFWEREKAQLERLPEAERPKAQAALCAMDDAAEEPSDEG